MTFDLTRFQHDIEAGARCLGAPYCPTTTAAALERFEQSFQQGVVQWKTTDRPGDGLYYRTILDREPSGLEQTANLSAPLLELHREVLAGFPGARRAGLDFHSSRGLAKIWSFTSPVPREAFLELSTVPRSLRRYRDLFSRFRLNTVGFVASNFLEQSMNVYFRWEPECQKVNWLKDLFLALDGTVLSDRDAELLAEAPGPTSGLGFTFDWQSDRLRRWCIYCLEVPARYLPDDDRLSAFHRSVPTLVANPSIQLGWSYGAAGPYLKMEKEYRGSLESFVRESLGVCMAR